MTITHKLITPQDAANMLTLAHQGHGPINKAKIAQFAEMMKTGSWNGTTPGRGLTITKGKLTNGRHRLHAVIKSGIPQIFTIETVK